MNSFFILALIAIIVVSEIVFRKILLPRKINSIAKFLNAEYRENDMSNINNVYIERAFGPSIYGENYSITPYEKGHGKHKYTVLRLFFKALPVKHEYTIHRSFFKNCPNWKKVYAFYDQNQSILGINLNFIMKAKFRLGKSKKDQFDYYKKELRKLFKPLIQNLLYDSFYKKMQLSKIKYLYISPDMTYIDISPYVSKKKVVQAINAIDFMYQHTA